MKFHVQEDLLAWRRDITNYRAGMGACSGEDRQRLGGNESAEGVSCAEDLMSQIDIVLHGAEAISEPDDLN